MVDTKTRKYRLDESSYRNALPPHRELTLLAALTAAPASSSSFEMGVDLSAGQLVAATCRGVQPICK
jgi:hypothetical protein